MENIKLILESLIGKKAFKIFVYVAILSLTMRNLPLIKKILSLISTRYPLSLPFIIIIIGLFALFKHSNYRSNINIQENLHKHNQPLKIYSTKFKGIYFLLTNYKFYQSKDKKQENIFQIINSNENIKVVSVSGKITLFSDGTETYYTKCFEKNFDISNLDSNTQQQVISTSVDLKQHSFTRYKVELQSLIFSDNSFYSNITLNSGVCLRNTYWILNHMQLYDYKLLFVKTKYNLKWLKQIIHRLKVFIQYKCSTKVFLGLNPTKEYIKAERKDFFEKWIYRIFLGVILLLSLTLFICSLIQSIELTYLFLQWVGNFFIYLFQLS